MASVYPVLVVVRSIDELTNKHNRLVNLLSKDLSAVVEGGGVGDVKSPIVPSSIDDTVVLFDGITGKRIKASTIYASWFDQAVATTSSPTFEDLTVDTINELTPTALEIGFSISGGDTSKTLTVPLDASVSGTNTGDQDLSGLVLATNVLTLDNTTAFTPDSDYEPATKKYVDDNAGGGDGGDVEIILDKIVNGGEGEINAQLEAIMTGGAMPPLSNPMATEAYVNALIGTPLAGTKVYYVADSSGGAVTRKLTFINGLLCQET